MEEMANLISNFGFPIVLVIYLFTRFERLFAEVIDSIERLEDLIQEHFRQEKETGSFFPIYDGFASRLATYLNNLRWCSTAPHNQNGRI